MEWSLLLSISVRRLILRLPSHRAMMWKASSADFSAKSHHRAPMKKTSLMSCYESLPSSLTLVLLLRHIESRRTREKGDTNPGQKNHSRWPGSVWFGRVLMVKTVNKVSSCFWKRKLPPPVKPNENGDMRSCRMNVNACTIEGKTVP